MNNVAVFWDYENCRAPSSMTGHEVVSKIRKVIANLGRIKLFRAYLDVLLDSRNAKSQQTHSELHLSGVSLVHCPHYGWNRKDVTDKTMLVDIMSLAQDWPPASTIVLISGDRDFSYAMATLVFQGFDVVVISPNDCTHASLKAHASHTYDWYAEVLGVTPQSGEYHAACDHTRSHSHEGVSSSIVVVSIPPRTTGHSCCDDAAAATSRPAGQDEVAGRDAFVCSHCVGNTNVNDSTQRLVNSASPTMVGFEREENAGAGDQARVDPSQGGEFEGGGAHSTDREGTGIELPGFDTATLTSQRVTTSALDDTATSDAHNTSSGVALAHEVVTQNQVSVEQVNKRETRSQLHPFSSIGSTPVDARDANVRPRPDVQDEREFDELDSESTSPSSLSPIDDSEEPSPVNTRQSRPKDLEEMSSYDTARSRTTTETTTLLNGSVEYNSSHTLDALRKLDKFMHELQTNSSAYRAELDGDDDDDDVGIRVTAIPETSDPFADPEPYDGEERLYGTTSRPDVYSREASVYGEAENRNDFDHDERSSLRPDSPEYIPTQRSVEAVYFLPSKSVDVPSLPVDIPLSSDEDDAYEAARKSNHATTISGRESSDNLSSFAERLQQTRCASEPPTLHVEDDSGRQDDGPAIMSEYTGEAAQYSIANDAWQWVPPRTSAGAMDRGISELNGFAHSRDYATDQGYNRERNTPVSRADVLGSVPSGRSSIVSFHSVRSGSSEFESISQKAAGKRPAVALGIPTISSDSHDSTATEIVSAATETVLDWRQNLREGASRLEGAEQPPAPTKETPPLSVPGKIASTVPSVASSTISSIPSFVRPSSAASYARTSQSAPYTVILANIDKFRLLVDILRQERNIDPPSNVMAASQLGTKMLQRDAKVYSKVGVSKLKAYLTMARDAGVVKFVGKTKGGEITVTLTKDYITDPPAPPAPSRPVAHSIAAITADIFTPLISSMKHLSPTGHVLASVLGEFLAKNHRGTYERAGARNFTQYVGMAEKAGVIRYQGEPPHAKRWVVFGENAGMYGAR